MAITGNRSAEIFHTVYRVCFTPILRTGNLSSV